MNQFFSLKHINNKNNTPKKTLLRKILFSLVIIGGAIFLFVLIYVITLFGELPDIKNIQNLTIAQSTVIYDRDGNKLYAIHGEENRKYIPLSDISNYAQKATIAMEDKEFYTHAGFDLSGMFRSALYNITHPDERVRGGSTITQQLVKNVFLSSETTIRRKLKELILAYQVEHTYNKDKILELYLNQIPYGSNAYGIEMAAQNYFTKTAKELDIVESAILAAIIKGPSFYSPYGTNKNALMGYCQSDKGTASPASEFDIPENTLPLKIKITAVEKIWFRVNMDGKREEVNLEKGQEKEFEAKQSLGILLGNLNARLSYQGLPFKKLTNKSFTITKETIRDFLEKPDDLDEKLLENQKGQAGNCTDINDKNYIKGRKDYVLLRMREDNYITDEELKSAWEKGKTIQFSKPKEEIKYPHFVMYVKDYLEEKYGKELVEKGGLQVTTTIDPKLQDVAQGLIDKNIDRLEKQFKMSNMALVSVNPKTGQIVSMIGSRDYWNSKDGNVNIITSRRQPGSSFKPFTYAAALSKGYGAGTALWDVKTQFGQGTPPNNADGAFLGPMTIRKALAWSRNIPAIKAYYLAGEENAFLDFLAPLGFSYLKEDLQTAKQTNPDFSYNWPMAIGSIEVRPLDMAQAFTIFANGGSKKDVTPILEIRDKDGNIIEKYQDAQGTQVIDPQVAYMINNILSDVDARPAGYWRDRITVPGQVVAAKTGTSNKRISKTLILPSDNWTIGYATNLVTVLWGGNNDGSAMAGTAFDINTIASIWRDFMKEALKNTPKEDFTKPEGITSVAVSMLSGKRVSQDTPKDFQTTDIFPSFGVPQEYDNAVVKVTVDKRNNLLATEDCAPGITEDKYIVKVQEITGKPEWDSAIAGWITGHAETFPSLITKMPEEKSSLCVPIAEDQKPSISLVAPLSYGEITTGVLNAFVNVSAHFGVDRVEYFFDNALVSTAKQYPYTGTLLIPRELEVGSTHAIKAIVYDKNQYSAESSIEVRISGTDTTPPHVSIIAPGQGDTLPLNSSVSFEVQAYDDNSMVKKVDLYVDGALIGTSNKSPYVFSASFSDTAYSKGEHAIKAKAVDNYGNASETASSFFLSDASNSSSTFDITEPASGSTVSKGDSVKVQFIVKGKEVKEVSLIAQRSDNVAFPLKTVTGGSENFVVYWTPTEAGTYQLFLKVLEKSGDLSYSNRVSVVVQ